jgi:transposase-like protein
MPKTSSRLFSSELRLSIVERIEAGESVIALARELNVYRQVLERWRDRVRRGGPGALTRKRGRPRKLVLVPPSSLPGPEPGLAAAQARIGELERKIGRQQLELDFFKRALRQVEELRQLSDGSGVTASTPSSKR